MREPPITCMVCQICIEDPTVRRTTRDDVLGCEYCTTECEKCGQIVDDEDGGYRDERKAWWCDGCA